MTNDKPTTIRTLNNVLSDVEFNALLSHAKLARYEIANITSDTTEDRTAVEGASLHISDMITFLVRIGTKAHGRFLSKSQAQYFNERLSALIHFAGRFGKSEFRELKRCLVSMNHIIFKPASDEYEIANGNGTTSAATAGV